MDLPTEELRILMLEDVPTDAELVVQTLQDEGLVFTSMRVDTEAAFKRALQEFAPHIALADYHLPNYNGREALEYTRRTHPQIPVIMVTGTLGDEAAVELLKLGARDYVLKSGLARLAPAIKRTLSEEQGIRARKIAEAKLKLFRTLLDNSNDAIDVIDPVTLRFLDINETECRVLGYSREELLSMSVFDIGTPISADMQKTIEAQLQQSGRALFETVHRRKDGTTFPVEISATSIEIDKPYLLSIARDITERKRAEEALRDSRESLSRLLNSMAEGAYGIDTHGDCTFVNRAFMQMLGYQDANEVLGKHIHDLIHHSRPDGSPLPASECKIYLAYQTNQPINVSDEVFWRKDGVAIPVEYWSYPIVTGGVVIGAIATFIDITDRKQTEIALVHANRALATLGAVNRHLVHAADEDELLQSVCQAIVDQRGYRLAWVGYVQHDENKSVKTMASAGHDEGYLDAMQLTWADTERGQGPTGRTVRSGTTQMCMDIASDPQSLPWRDKALQCGYASSIALALLNGDNSVFGTLTVYADEVNTFIPSEISLLEEMAGDLAFGVHTLHTRHERDLALELNQKQLAQLQANLKDTVRAIASIVEMRDPYTAGHQVRVADLAAAIATQMGLPDEQVQAIHLAGVVHDLGKIQIPAEILSKPGKISAAEFSMIKGHPQAGHDILKGIDFPWPIAQMVLQHHEKLDGSGYPQGLKGDAILLEARILSVADVVEAMTSHRPYRPGLGIDVALEEITRSRGIHYDPQVVDACLALFREQHYSFNE